MLAVCLLSEGQRLYLHWSHKVFYLFSHSVRPLLLLLFVVHLSLPVSVCLVQTGITVTLIFSVMATAVLADSKAWKTLLLSLQVSDDQQDTLHPTAE